MAVLVHLGACVLQVQQSLGCKRAVAFDLTAACSGFVLGLVTASRFIRGESVFQLPLCSHNHLDKTESSYLMTWPSLC